MFSYDNREVGVSEDVEQGSVGMVLIAGAVLVLAIIGCAVTLYFGW